MAEKYDYSIKGLTADLHREGVWPNKCNKEGVETYEIDEEGIARFQPAGYQTVYKAEREAGTKSVGHFVNTASAMFGRLNPNKASKPARPNSGGSAGTPGKAPATIDEKIQSLESIVKSMTADEINDWLDASPTMTKIMDGRDNDASAEAGDIDLDDI
jgi:hypothetical protein